MRSLQDLNPLLEGYWTTKDGNVISRKNKELKQYRRNYQSRCPYLCISVYDKSVRYARPFFVHRLVAYQYCDLQIQDITGLVVNHIDGNPYNNCAYNLEWVTQKENINKSKSIILL
jgi:hypothetical protein